MIRKFLDLGLQPLANKYLTKKENTADTQYKNKALRTALSTLREHASDSEAERERERER